MTDSHRIVCIIGPTASGKTAKALELAALYGGEVISVDSRQVYKTLDIGTEKIAPEEMRGIPHHLIDVREPEEVYSAGDFVLDARRLINEIHSRGKMPILAGGTHFYFDALLHGLPEQDRDPGLRAELQHYSAEELLQRLAALDPDRASAVDPHNTRRIIRSIELATHAGKVLPRPVQPVPYSVEWHVVSAPKDELRKRIDMRLHAALERGLIEEVATARERLGDERLRELGLEYRVIAEYLRGERTKESIHPTLSSQLWRYAKQQQQWVRRLVPEASSQ